MLHSAQARKYSSHADHGERRMYDRFSVSEIVHLELGREKWVHARALDVSRGGFRCITSEEVPIGTTVDIRFSIGSEEFNGRALVVHASPRADGDWETGFEFFGLSNDAKTTVETLLKERSL